jgi:hypothetical protein
MACKAYRLASRGRRVGLRHATSSAASSGVTTVERGGFGPIGASLTSVRCFPFATVVGGKASRLARLSRLA